MAAYQLPAGDPLVIMGFLLDSERVTAERKKGERLCETAAHERPVDAGACSQHTAKARRVSSHLREHRIRGVDELRHGRRRHTRAQERTVIYNASYFA